MVVFLQDLTVTTEIPLVFPITNEMNDPIADMIIRMKNAGEAGKQFVVVPYSKMKFAIAELLEEEGFIKAIARKGKKDGKLIEIELAYENDSPRIKGVERVSKSSRRVYLKSKNIKPVKNYFGLLILTTPRGVMTNKEARHEKVGGEALFKIW